MSNPAQGAVGAETMTAGQSLDCRDLHAANIARQAEWCPDQVPDLSFRGNELGGECGEAQNVIKKLERERQGWRGSRATKDDLADELADVVICVDLCAVTADIDLGAAVRRKFNATSEKQGLSVFLPLPVLASPRADSGERTADEGTEWFWRIVDANGSGNVPSDEGEALRLLCTKAAWYDEMRSTPAQPAGAVPDSLRALSEAAAPFAACVFNDNGDITISTGSLCTNDWLRLSRSLAVAARHVATPEAPHDAPTSIRLAIASVNVHAEASEYEFRADEGDHTPTDAERAMLEDFGEQILSRLEAALISTAPTSPVPENLEALTEKLAQALEPKAFADWEADYQSRLRHQQQTGAKPGPTFEGMGAIVVMKAARERAKALLEGPLASLLASHPAGQSAGSGAETVKWGSANTVGELMAQLRTLPADAKIFGTFKGPEDKGDDYRTGVRGVLLSRERVRGRWIRTQDKEAPYEHVIWTVPEPAPDSTRTGQGEAGAADLIRQVDAILRKPPEPVSHPSEAWCDDYADWHDAYVVARSKVLAARPAAPEAQGAWLPEQAAEWLRGLARRSKNKQHRHLYHCTADAFLRETAPPASSGQGAAQKKDRQQAADEFWRDLEEGDMPGGFV